MAPKLPALLVLRGPWLAQCARLEWFASRSAISIPKAGFPNLRENRLEAGRHVCLSTWSRNFKLGLLGIPRALDAARRSASLILSFIVCVPARSSEVLRIREAEERKSFVDSWGVFVVEKQRVRRGEMVDIEAQLKVHMSRWNLREEETHLCNPSALSAPSPVTSLPPVPVRAQADQGLSVVALVHMACMTWATLAKVLSIGESGVGNGAVPVDEDGREGENKRGVRAAESKVGDRRVTHDHAEQAWRHQTLLTSSRFELSQIGLSRGLGKTQPEGPTESFSQKN
ncbi:hypothetical protein C8F01DRAFT_1236785 [Mycena amicta]|nr:hypothetical protein C8F01DRAFT_1236785 [Mycena amicta]